jgi:integrase
MKGKASEYVPPHRVPLAPQTIEILRLAYNYAIANEITLEELPSRAALRGNALIFATPRDPRKQLSDNALSKIIRDMNEGQTPPPWRDADGRALVPHGLRSAFRSWADDTHPTERKAAEAALGHREGNQVVAAYARSDVFERRIPLMRAWANICHHAPTPVATMPVISPNRQAR